MDARGGESRNEGALEQSLRVDHDVVGAFIEFVAKLPDVGASTCAEGPLSPRPDTAPEDPVNARMQRRNRRERTLDDPVDASLRKSGPDVRNHRQVVHDVAE